MNKMNILSSITCAILVIALSATVGCTLKGEYNNMATITTLNNSDAMSVSRASINTNFSNVNSELIADTTAIGTLASLNTTNKTDLVSAINEVNSAKVTSIYGEMWSNVTAMNLLTLTTAGTWYYYTSELELKYGSGITYENNALKIGTAGMYLVTYTISVAPSYGDADLTTAILKNGTALANGQTYNVFESTGGYTRSISCSFFEQFSANDLVKIGFKKDLPATLSIDSYSYHLTISKI